MFSIVNYFYSQQITCGMVLTDAIEYLNILPPKFHSERPSPSDSPWQLYCANYTCVMSDRHSNEYHVFLSVVVTLAEYFCFESRWNDRTGSHIRCWLFFSIKSCLIINFPFFFSVAYTCKNKLRVAVPILRFNIKLC